MRTVDAPLCVGRNKDSQYHLKSPERSAIGVLSSTFSSSFSSSSIDVSTPSCRCGSECENIHGVEVRQKKRHATHLDFCDLDLARLIQYIQDNYRAYRWNGFQPTERHGVRATLYYMAIVLPVFPFSPKRTSQCYATVANSKIVTKATIQPT